MSKKKILFLVTSLGSGGIENYLLRYLQFDTKCDAMILCKSAGGGQLEPKYIDRLGIDNIIKLKVGFADPVSWYKLYKVIKVNGINTVCDFTGEVGGIPMLIAYFARCKKRLIFYRHSQYPFKMNLLKLIFIRFNKILIEKFTTKILSNSNAALNFYHPRRDIKSTHYQVIYNGITDNFIKTDYDGAQMRVEISIPFDVFVVGHTGRADKPKNHKTILEVAKIVCQKSSNIHFLLAGRDTELLEVEQYRDRIHCLGYRNDIGRVLSAIDLFYFPSLTEGQPNSLIEAMVKGKSILASNIAPIIESVPESILPELVSPLDAELASEKILQAFNDEHYLQSLRCRDWAINQFDAQRLFTEFKTELQ